MKKILAMLLMCMLLCVLSTAALAAKVTFSNYEIWNEVLWLAGYSDAGLL